MEKISTYFDEIYDLLKKNNEMSLEDISRKIGLEEVALRRYLNVFEEMNALEIVYPVTHARKGLVKFKIINPQKIWLVSTPASEMEVIKTYSISLKNLSLKIKICNIKDDITSSYIVTPMEVGDGTKWLIEFVKKQIPTTLALNDDEYLDVNKSEKRLKDSVTESINTIIEERCIYEESIVKEKIKDISLNESIGFGIIDMLLEDEDLEEIIIQGSKNPVSIYHRKYGWMKTNVFIESETHIINMADNIARKVRRTLSTLNPILDAYRSGGERICAVLYPITTQGNTIVIRKFKKNPWTMVNFIDPKIKSINLDLAALIWLSVQYELNILVCGGTASGKTSFLNAVCQFIPPWQHVVTIEEVEELTLPDYMRWNWIPMVERKPVTEKGEVPMHELVVASLRMRPDRIIIGEVRRSKEAEVLFESMHTGHSACCTMHADTSYQVYRRLIDKPFNIPPIELEALHLVIVQRRDRRTGLRRTYEVAEIESPELNESSEFILSVLYRWNAKEDEIIQMNRPKRVYEEISFHTGMNEKEIDLDLDEKKSVLKWMLENEIKTVNGVGRVVSEYYRNKSRVLDWVKENKKASEIGFLSDFILK